MNPLVGKKIIAQTKAYPGLEAYLELDEIEREVLKWNNKQVVVSYKSCSVGDTVYGKYASFVFEMQNNQEVVLSVTLDPRHSKFRDFICLATDQNNFELRKLAFKDLEKGLQNSKFVAALQAQNKDGQLLIRISALISRA